MGRSEGSPQMLRIRMSIREPSNCDSTKLLNSNRYRVVCSTLTLCVYAMAVDGADIDSEVDGHHACACSCNTNNNYNTL